MTERREMEEALRQAKERAEAAAQARSSFLANMSHEIRTPMNAILGFTDIVLASEVADESRRHLETVRRSARSLLHLLNDILDSSKLERGALELEQLHYSLPELLEQIQRELGLAASKKALFLQVQVDPLLPPVLMGDPHRMRQVLVNLTGNAIKFTEQGGVTVHAWADEGQLRIDVQDTGIGIAADRLPHIFDAFTQADASMSRRFGGTGLGTTISKQLVELMHGTLSVSSQLGEGSCFTLRLPLKEGRAALQEHLLPKTAPTLPPLRVLCVDDVPQNIELLKLMLQRGGHEVGQASDGQQAFDSVCEHAWDVVLMDVQMPVMDGLEATRRLRAREEAQGLPRLPVIALSASVMNEDRQLALDAGMDGFAHKPVELDILLGEIARVCGLEASLADTPERASVPPGHDHPAAGHALPPERIDHARALRRWGDPEAYHDALRQWLAQSVHAGPGDSPPPDVAQAAALVHRLGGVAGNLGLALVADVCAQLEASCRLHGHVAAPLWLELVQAWQRTQEDLMAWQARQPWAASDDHSPADEHASHEGDLEALRKRLPTVIRRLRQGEAIDADWAGLQQLAGRLLSSQQARQVNQALDDFDHDQAAQVLADWLDTLPPHQP